MNVQVENHNRQLNPCDELRDLLPAYALGAVTPDEAARVEALLLDCPEGAAELPEYAALLGDLALTVEPVRPPAALFDQIMTAASAPAPFAAATQTPVLRLPVAPVQAAKPSASSRRGFPVRITLIAAAAAALLILSNAYWLGQLGSLRTERDRLDAVLSALDSGSAQRISLLSAENVVYARVIYDPASGSAVLFSEALPPLPADRTYQLWLLNDADVTSVGIFGGEADGVAQVLPPSLVIPQSATFAISVEPLGGSTSPTTDPIAFGSAAGDV